MIDSELVPWGKGEKQAVEADEIEPETICLQGIEALPLSLRASLKSKLKRQKSKVMKFEIYKVKFQTD